MLADEALQRLASGARDDGDADFAAFVEQRLEFLRRVRAALNRTKNANELSFM